MNRKILIALLLILFTTMHNQLAWAGQLRGEIVDAATGAPIAARLYVQAEDGTLLQVESVGGTAVPYEKQRSAEAHEAHTTLSADPFHAELPLGEYTLVAERGKEYFPATETVAVAADKTTHVTLSLKRWSNMAERGWYSGETHVHRTVAELPTLLLAEDLNVAFPLTAWVTDSRAAPAKKSNNPEAVPPARLIEADATHVIWPINTEYEISTVEGKRHTLGAVFVLNHREQFALRAPPVGPIAAEARRQGAFLELDKHSWPWSMMLVPQMQVELFELANNHMWRTEFFYKDWFPEYVDPAMQVEMAGGEFTERAWIDFGLQTYYALLNCGFDLKPTAGTASGVHPVPLGFGRVYVKIDGGFSYHKWVRSLLAGQSFVTTGPMLTAGVTDTGNGSVLVKGVLESATRPELLEIVVNGVVQQTIDLPAERTESGAFRVAFDESLPIAGSSWVAVRAFAARPGGRVSFAHTATVHIEITGKPLLPARWQRDYLVRRVADEIERNRGVISPEALSEFEQARERFEALKVAE